MSSLLLATLFALPIHADTFYITVAGIGGDTDYEQRFTASANDLERIFRSSASAHVYTLTGKQSTRAQVQETFASVSKEAKSGDDLVVTLIGHGTYDGAEYKFNLPGPDISAGELAALCNRIAARRQLVVNTTSASGGSVAALERPGRAVIAATKSGTEKNATVFARYWEEGLGDPTSDLDKSGSISALEMFLYADQKTSAFYESQKRLATEHAVFEDTGRGEPVRSQSTAGREGALMASIAVMRIGSAQAAMRDPAHRELLVKKEDLEEKIDVLKYQKAAMEPGDYKQKLTELLVQLAKTQAELDQ